MTQELSFCHSRPQNEEVKKNSRHRATNGNWPRLPASLRRKTGWQPVLLFEWDSLFGVVVQFDRDNPLVAEVADEDSSVGVRADKAGVHQGNFIPTNATRVGRTIVGN